MTRDDARRLGWERRTRGPFLLLALAYLVAWTVLAIEPTSAAASAIAFIVMVLIWLTFALDFLVRLALAERRGDFVLGNLPDLLAVLLPVLRPVVQLRHLNTTRMFGRRTGAAQRFRFGLIAAVFAVTYVYSIALAVLMAERGADGAVILTLGNALWWACVTLFTVGYGDFAPVTVMGRIWAVALMVGGVAIIGMTSAIVVSYLNDHIARLRTGSGNSDGADPEGPTPSPDVESD